jgi:hypothetical protein
MKWGRRVRTCCCQNQDHHPPAQVAHRNHPNLAIFGPVVLNPKGLACQNLNGIGKIEPPHRQSRLTFGRIEGDVHEG